jgi:hypothetical protein
VLRGRITGIRIFYVVDIAVYDVTGVVVVPNGRADLRLGQERLYGMAACGAING